MSPEPLAGRPRGAAGRIAALLGLAVGLASCQAVTETTGAAFSRTGDAMGSLFRGTSEKQVPITEQLATSALRCPQVRIQPDTEVIRRDDGSGAQSALRWQASITKTARDCSDAAEGITVRVGVAGRVIEGPRGAPDRLELPLRIAVRQGTQVTYSRVHNVALARSGPSQDWAYVEENIAIKDPSQAEIVVGFDG